MGQNPDVAELTRRAATGDAAALHELVAHYQPALQAFIRLKVGKALLGRESSSDLAQSVCREVLEKASAFRFDGEQAFRRWLYTEARRKIADKHAFYRAQRRDVGRDERVGSSEDADELNRLYAHICTPSQHAVAREQMHRFEAAFAALPDEYREVILLSRVLGNSSADTAAEMGRTVSAVRNLLFRAMNQLAAAVEDDA